MTATYSTFDAKTRLSEILERVAEGEEIVITKHGRPVAKVVPHAPANGERELGWGRNQIKLLPGWDEPLSDEELIGE